MATLARVVLAATFIAACSPTPTPSLRPSAVGTPAAPSASSLAAESPASPFPTATTAAVEPTPPLEHVAIHWERVPALEGHSINGITAGAAGWVAVGDCQPQEISLEGCPTAWTSTDGVTWTDRPMPHEWNTTGVGGVTAVRDGYAAFGGDQERNVIMPRSEQGPRVWRSEDGRSWDLSRTTLRDLLRRGESIQDVSVTPSGMLLAVILRTRGSQFQYTGPWVSRNGRDWRLLDVAGFGLDTLNVDRIDASSNGTFLAGWPCGGDCTIDTYRDGEHDRSGIWTSVNGLEWTAVAAPGSLPGPAEAFATNGTHNVALVRICTSECHKELWATGPGGAWQFAHGPIDGDGLQPIQLVSAHSAILIVRRGYDVLASFDGLTWTAVESDTDTVSGVCGPGYVAIQDDMLIAVHGAGESYGYGWERCPAWRGTISVVPGPGEPPAVIAPGTTIPPDD